MTEGYTGVLALFLELSSKFEIFFKIKSLKLLLSSYNGISFVKVMTKLPVGHQRRL